MGRTPKRLAAAAAVMLCLVACAATRPAQADTLISIATASAFTQTMRLFVSASGS